MAPPRVLLVCSGLDHAHRGYESFARECFAALRGGPDVAIELVKSSGRAGPGEHVAPSLRRDRLTATTLGRALHARPFRFEALTFGWTLQPLLIRHRPDVVYVSEWDTARVLARSRALTRLRFRLLFCNGGFASSGFEPFDHVQELTPAGRDWVLARGADPRRHTVLPMGFAIERDVSPAGAAERRRLRELLRLPPERTVVLSVAALNRHHKRLDFLIEELAALPEPRPFLLLDGQPEEETSGLHALARERLGDNGYQIRTSPSEQLPQVLRAADLFVLPSLIETQGRALIEAAAQCVPCLAHDSPIMRYALGEHALLVDLAGAGSLSQRIAAALAEPAAPRDVRSRAAHQHVYERFSWERLRGRYVEFLRGVANSTVSSSSGENAAR